MKIVFCFFITSLIFSFKGKNEICQNSIHHQGMFGSIVSPYYPENYINNISCLWGVRAPPQHVVGIKIGEFILEGGMQEKSDDGEKIKKVKNED